MARYVLERLIIELELAGARSGHVELELLDWLNCFNYQRLLRSFGNIQPAEFEELYYPRREDLTMVVGPA
jgi:transposase InsO family protein